MRIAARVFGGIALLALLLYVADFAVWRIKISNGGGMGQITVGMLQVVPLKGNKEVYYPDGSSEVACSRSLFPQAGAGACWWVARHRTVFER